MKGSEGERKDTGLPARETRMNSSDGCRRPRLSCLAPVRFERRDGETSRRAAQRLMEIWQGCSGGD